MTTPIPPGTGGAALTRFGDRLLDRLPLAEEGEWWVSDGVPAWATTAGRQIRRLPLLAGRTLWPDRPPKGPIVVACPNRLGLVEAVPAWVGETTIVWVTDLLDADRSPWQEVEAASVLVEPHAEMGGTDLSLAEAARRSGAAADALAGHLRSVPGCQVPAGRHGRRLAALVEVAPAAVRARVPEAHLPEPPVPGWPGCVVFECDWRWPPGRAREVADAVEELVRAERAADRHRMAGVDQEPS